MIQAQRQSTPDGAILFDPGIMAQANGSDRARFDSDWFEPTYWRAHKRAADLGGGRGGVSVIYAPFGHCVLRHYRRGGMAARMLGDRYLWTGAERTRGFIEFRLLTQLQARGLNVPAPVAARYRRDGVHYRADLITRRIDGAITLAQWLPQDRDAATVAARVGATIAQFHAAGAYHADLNAHNVLLVGDAVWLLDFDRGELRTPQPAWRLTNLARLRRSLRKLGAARDGETGFEHRFWNPLMAAYERHFTQLSCA